MHLVTCSGCLDVASSDLGKRAENLLPTALRWRDLPGNFWDPSALQKRPKVNFPLAIAGSVISPQVSRPDGGSLRGVQFPDPFKTPVS